LGSRTFFEEDAAIAAAEHAVRLAQAKARLRSNIATLYSLKELESEVVDFT
jgi:hypothetical protein